MVGHGAVQAARADIQIDLVLCVVGHHVHTQRLEFTQSIFFLCAGFEHANLLALQRRRAGVIERLLGHHTAGRVVVLVGEVYLFEPIFGDGHGTDDDVVFTRHQARNHAVPALFHKDALALDLLAQGVGDVHVKTGRLAFDLVGEGLVGGVDRDFQVFALGKSSGAQGAEGNRKQ